jgi:hypothetical protein
MVGTPRHVGTRRRDAITKNGAHSFDFAQGKL